MYINTNSNWTPPGVAVCRASVRARVNTKCVLHFLSGGTSAGKLCYTACGWQCTGLQFEVRATLPEGLKHRAMCGTCLPVTRLLEIMD